MQLFWLQGGKETDLLAIFEDGSGYRFALHVEVKQPTDAFRKGEYQAAAYSERAACWVTPGRTPAGVIPHLGATTALLCANAMLNTSPSHVAQFGAVFTFEMIAELFDVHFPHLVEQLSVRA